MDGIDGEEFIHVFMWFDFSDKNINKKPKAKKEEEKSNLVNDGGEGNEVIDNESAKDKYYKGDEAGKSREFRFGCFREAR